MTAPGTADDLLQQAWQARERAYCPYSGFAVGAALQTSSGAVYSACNVENASLGLSVCAERNAVAAAVAGGMRPGMLTVLALVADTPQPALPCGACLQVLAEFAAPGCQVVSATLQGPQAHYALRDLMPRPFKL